MFCLIRMSSYTRTRFTLNAHQKPIVGDTKTSVVGSDHMGWLKCDGRFLSKDEWYLLFRVIGYSFGQDGELFRLPNAAGTVPGIVGRGMDSNTSEQYETFVLGTQVGEYRHRLTIAEMPTHNHGVEADAQPNNNQTSDYTHSHRGDGTAGTGGLTSNSYTGITINSNVTSITINSNTTGVYDSGHTHDMERGDAGSTNDRFGQATGVGNFDGVSGGGAANIVDNGHAHTITDPQHNHTINDPTHNHGITADTHFHTIIPAGGSNTHNNIQPTLPIGNLFIYTGRSQYPLGGFPYTAGTQLL
jgi:microcystin-dependent protein